MVDIHNPEIADRQGFFRFEVNLTELQWLLLACTKIPKARPNRPPAPENPWKVHATLGNVNERLSLATTDSYRLHLVKVGPEIRGFEPVMLNIRKLIDFLKFAKSKSVVGHILTEGEGAGVKLYAHLDNGMGLPVPEGIVMPEKEWEGYSPVSFDRAIPQDGKQDFEVALNPRYVKEACWLAEQNKERVQFHISDRMGPVKIDGIGNEWLAVVMPMYWK